MDLEAAGIADFWERHWGADVAYNVFFWAVEFVHIEDNYKNRKTREFMFTTFFECADATWHNVRAMRPGSKRQCPTGMELCYLQSSKSGISRQAIYPLYAADEQDVVLGHRQKFRYPLGYLLGIAIDGSSFSVNVVPLLKQLTQCVSRIATENRQTNRGMVETRPGRPGKKLKWEEEDPYRLDGQTSIEDDSRYARISLCVGMDHSLRLLLTDYLRQISETFASRVIPVSWL